MSVDPSGGRWAAEAFDFLRLHERVGSRFYGLLMLQLGWILLVWLVTRLFPDGAAYELGLPTVELDALPQLQIHFVAARVNHLYSVGAITLTVIWLGTSRLYLLIARPLTSFFRALAALLVTIARVAITLIALPIAALLVCSRRGLSTRTKHDSHEGEVTPAANTRNGKANKQVQTLSDEILKAAADTGSLWGLTDWILQLTIAPGAIGLAPIHSFSFAEESLAARVPLQLFSEAEGRIRAAIGQNLPAPPRLVVLPLALRVSGPDQARLLRMWLGLDALIWGTYSSTTPPRLWINITGGKRRAQNGHLRVRYFDPMILDSGASSMSVDQDSSLDASIVLADAMLWAARSRRERPRILRPKGTDKFGLSTAAYRDAVAEFALEILPGLPSRVNWGTAEPTAKKRALSLALDWVRIGLHKKAGYTSEEPSTLALQRVVQRIREVAPDLPDGYYLAALLSLLENNFASARDFIDQGWRCDAKAHLLTLLDVWAFIELTLRDPSLSGRDIRYANAAVCAAIAMKLDPLLAAEKLRTTLTTRHEYEMRMLDSERPDPVGGERFLYELLELPWHGEHQHDEP